MQMIWIPIPTTSLWYDIRTIRINPNLFTSLHNRDIKTCQVPVLCRYYMKLYIYFKYIYFIVYKKNFVNCKTIIMIMIMEVIVLAFEHSYSVNRGVEDKLE